MILGQCRENLSDSHLKGNNDNSSINIINNSNVNNINNNDDEKSVTF